MAIQLEAARSKPRRGRSHPRPLHGIFETLVKEHRELSWHLEEMLACTDASTREPLFLQLRTELLAHDQIEGHVLYGLLRHHGATQHIADEHERDAEELAYLVDQLEAQSSCMSESWDMLIEELAQMMKKHMRREETEFFPLAQEILGDDTVDLLDWKYRERKLSLRTHLT